MSLADLIVLGGTAADRGRCEGCRSRRLSVPFTPGRTDATQEMTDVESFAVARAEGRRLPELRRQAGQTCPTEHLLIDKAYMLNLSAPQMTALVGGLRVSSAPTSRVTPACSPTASGQLTNDFFVNLLDMGT